MKKVKIVTKGLQHRIIFKGFYEDPAMIELPCWSGYLFFSKEAYWGYSKGHFFLRLWSRLFLCKDTTTHPLLFSQRNKIVGRKGYKSFMIGKYYFEFDQKAISL